jgi:mercuric ion transport protein
MMTSAAIQNGARVRLPSVGLAVLVAVVPKCALCVVAHVTVLGWLGISVVPAAIPRPVAALALAAVPLMLAWRAPARRGYGPCALACVAAVLLAGELTHLHADAGAMHAGHHAMSAAPAAEHSSIAPWLGAALLVSASLWNAWPRRRHPPSCAHHC